MAITKLWKEVLIFNGYSSKLSQLQESQLGYIFYALTTKKLVILNKIILFVSVISVNIATFGLTKFINFLIS